MKPSAVFAIFAAVASAATSENLGSHEAVVERDTMHQAAAAAADAAHEAVMAREAMNAVDAAAEEAHAAVYARQTPSPTPGAAVNPAAPSLGSLLALVEKIVQELGYQVPALKDTAAQVKDALEDFAEAAKKIDPEDLLRPNTDN